MGGELHYVTQNHAGRLPGVRHVNYAAAPEFAALPAATATVQVILQQWHDARHAPSMPPITEDTMPGELPNIVAGRVANVLNLRGPNFITDAACASSASPPSTPLSRCSPSTTWMR
jgi:hypothetical protein